jgi:hypothetical protein
VGIAGDLAGQLGEAHRLPIGGQDPRQYLNRDRQNNGGFRRWQAGDCAAGAKPVDPLSNPFLIRQPALGQPGVGQPAVGQAAVESGPQQLAASPDGLPVGGQVAQRCAGEVGDDADQAASGRAGPQGRVEVGQADPGRTASDRPPEQPAEPVGTVVV